MRPSWWAWLATWASPHEVLVRRHVAAQRSKATLALVVLAQLFVQALPVRFGVNFLMGDIKAD